MQRILSKDCSQLLKLSNKNGSYLIQEVKYPSDIDIYKYDNIKFMNEINQIPDNYFHFVTFCNELDITSELSFFLKIVQQTLNQLILQIEKKKIIVKRVNALSKSKQKLKTYYGKRDSKETQEENKISDDIENEFNISNIHQNQLSADDEVLLELLKLSISLQKQQNHDKNLEFPQIVKDLYEELLIDRQEIGFEKIFINPFKLNSHQLNNIYLDIIYATFTCKLKCGGSHSLEYTTDIDELQQFKTNHPLSQIEVNTINLTIESSISHKSSYSSKCERCRNKYFEKDIDIIDLSDYFSNIKRIDILNSHYSSYEFSIGLNIKFQPNDFRIYYRTDALFWEEQDEVIIQFNEGEDENGLIEIPNLLTKKTLLVAEGYKDLYIKEDQTILKIVIFNKFNLQELLPINQQKIIYDLLSP